MAPQAVVAVYTWLCKDAPVDCPRCFALVSSCRLYDNEARTLD